MVGFGLGLAGFILALTAFAVALWQVRDARRALSLQSQVDVVEALIAADLAGRRRPEILEQLFQLLEDISRRLTRGDPSFCAFVKLIEQVFQKGSLTTQ